MNKLIPSLDKEYTGQTAFGLENTLSDIAMDKLWEYISNAKENPISNNASLAGNISSSLTLNDTDNWFFDNVCHPTITEHKGILKGQKAYHSRTIFKNNIPYVLSTFWVNFQKQYEFNPLHDHKGVFSFVIFMKIPYDWREQYEIPFVKNSNAPSAGNFEFVYTDIMGQIRPYNYKLDSSYEGIMLFFPAEMMHMVYPFYNCEEERITISGNIIYDI